MIQPSFDDLEVWLPVVGWESFYEVSSLGRVRSLPRPKGHAGRPGGAILKPGVQTNGYLIVTLARPGKRLTRTVHRLVLETFVGPRPKGEETRHLDGNKLNNRLSNLTYGDHKSNMEDVARHGTHRNTRKTHCDSGHKFTPENTYTPPGTTWRDCIECQQIRDADRPRGRPKAIRSWHTCPVCGASFMPKRRDGIYCSQKCGEAGRHPRGLLLPRTCPICGTTFTPKRKRTAVYCSGKCEVADWRRKREADKPGLIRGYIVDDLQCRLS